MRSWKSSNCSWEVCGGVVLSTEIWMSCTATCHASGTLQCQACLNTRGDRQGHRLLCGPSLKSVSLMTLCCPYPPENQAHPSLTHLTGGAAQVLFLALGKVPPFNARWLPVVTWLLIWFILTKPVYFGACQQSPRTCEEHVCGCVSMLLCIVPSLKKKKKERMISFSLTKFSWRKRLNQISLLQLHCSFHFHFNPNTVTKLYHQTSHKFTGMYTIENWIPIGLKVSKVSEM